MEGRIVVKFIGERGLVEVLGEHIGCGNSEKGSAISTSLSCWRRVVSNRRAAIRTRMWVAMVDMRSNGVGRGMVSNINV